MTTTKENKTLYLMMILYALFAFLTPLTSTMVVVLYCLAVLSVILLNDTDLLCFLAFAVCFMYCGGFTSFFLTMYDVILALFIVKKLVVAIKENNKKHIKFISAMLVLTLYYLFTA